MKKLITLIVLISSFANAQYFEVEYETQVKTKYNEKGLKWFEEKIENPLERRETIEANVNPPKEYYLFKFNDSEANISYIKKVNNSQGAIQRFIVTPTNFGTNYFYYDFKNNLRLEERDLYGRKFIIKNNFKNLNFVDNNETKEILGYKTQQAVATDGTLKILVWYTKEIKNNFSPDIYLGANGFVLREEIIENLEDRERVTVIEAIKIKPLKKVQISIPKKGEIVTENEFKKINLEVNRQRDEAYEQSQGNGIDKK
ncbi:GLPGLI family protein [Empedobacter sedimenti]|uniref:GLPGLI family protein n=1 Tax=Empedobacter sedimenti TaxID=3042610 RepID=UPI0024A6273C|nr:GLPGLI family protein [Empedobacter sedimenti]